MLNTSYKEKEKKKEKCAEYRDVGRIERSNIPSGIRGEKKNSTPASCI